MQPYPTNYLRSRSSQAELECLLGRDAVVKYLAKYQIFLTQENYLAVAYPDGVPDESLDETERLVLTQLPLR